jgi:Uma2 family endonuclease
MILATPTAESIQRYGEDVPTEPIFRLSVEQYHEMIRAGILVDGDPVELLEGWLVQKMTKNPGHRLATYLTREALTRVVPSSYYVDSQEPVTTSDSEPEPDTAVVRGKPRDYPDRHPGPRDVALLVEVADSSLRRDSTLKKRIYARAEVPVYWIVNLIERRIEVYTNPSGAGEHPDYQQRQDYGENDEVPVVLDGKEVGRIRVRDLLP